MIAAGACGVVQPSFAFLISDMIATFYNTAPVGEAGLPVSFGGGWGKEGGGGSGEAEPRVSYLIFMCPWPILPLSPPPKGEHDAAGVVPVLDVLRHW